MRPYMTEDEAKRRWCPMVRDYDAGGGSASNSCWSEEHPDSRNPRYSRCCASECMWWGWLERRGADLDNGVPNPYLDKKLGRCEAPGGAK